ncbi:methionyl-tRNA formyltransferase [Marinobacter sediminum]|uniref:methionyl-tRNA formyltransferase n=1 Tax=Marinobacter sediminum TaxID=256323 RepID=UPI00193A10A7|nr:methionyl-tRNA formyltransferase [Marinobacter sediminum]
MDTNTYIFATSKPWHQPQATELLPGEYRYLWAKDPVELGAIIDKEPDIRYIFFLHWNWLVPEQVWKNHECVCFHMTDVPYGRGGSPLQNLIVRGHTSTKLTALRMVEEMDAGPVYTKRDMSLSGTAEEIYKRAGELSFDVIKWMIDAQPQPTPQQGTPTIFKRRKPAQSELPMDGRVHELYDHIRMLDAPTYPSAFIEYGEFVIEFSDAEVDGEALKASVRITKKPI